MQSLLSLLMASALVDTRLLAKPQDYSNNRAEWPLFKFTVKTYIGAVDEEMLESFNAAEQTTDIIPLARLSEKKRAHARAIMYILVSCLRGSSLQLAMNVEASNGLETWRLLVKREEPTEGSTQVAQLMAILKTTFTGGIANMAN